MVTQIQLGGLFSVNGRQVVGGGASGIDTEALIKGLTEARLVPAKKLQDKIDLSDKKAAALSEMRGILNRFKDATNFLRNAPGVGNQADNIFSYRTASVKTNTATPASSYVSVTVEPGAQVGNYIIDNVVSIAKATKQESSNFSIANQDTQVVYAGAGPGQFEAGTVTINGQNITLAAGDTLRTVAKKFNDLSGSTGITAQVFQALPGQFKLLFSATKTGVSSSFDLSGAPTVSSDPSGVLSNISFTTTQPAGNAQFDINNISVIRESNNIDDLVENVTFNLLQDTTTAPTTQIDINIVQDTETIQSAITNFADAYNEFRLFTSRQTAVNSDGTPKEDSLLFNDSTMRSALASVNAELSRTVAGIAASDPNRLSEIGLTFTNYPGDNNDPPNPPTKNILTIDSAKLKSSIETNFEAVRRVFEFDFNSDSSSVQVFSRTNALNVQSFSMLVDPGTNTFTATYDPGTGPVTVNLTGTALSGGTGYTLSGVEGTPLEGLVMIYTGNATSTVNVNVTQGIGDRLFSALDGFLKDTTGMLSVNEKSISDAKERSQREIDRINEQVDKYREQLIKQYAALEAAITKVNNILTSLDANARAQYAS